MQDNWLSFIDLDGGSSDIFRTKALLPLPLRCDVLCQIILVVNNSLQRSRDLHVSGSLALRDNFSCISKFAGALLVWLTSSSSYDLHHELSGSQRGSKPGRYRYSSQAKLVTSYKDNLTGLQSGSRSRVESSGWVFLGKIVSSIVTLLGKEIQQLQSIPELWLTAASLPQFGNLSSKFAAVQENTDVQINGHMDQVSHVRELRGCADLSFPQLNWTGHASEPRTGIKFPTVLHNIFAGENNISTMSEILVGTGFRSMRIMKVKSLKVYAFGLYVQPDSVCKKLGPKYASMPVNELNNQPELLEDLFREDINMTVRLVVNCNGLKTNTVRNAFERSLQTRLAKMNPNTDHHCLRTFSSYFKQDIPLPQGTTIDFRQTADGQLITKIGGKQIGAIHSKDLCRAFFDIYVSDVSASVQSKEEITRNIASIIRRY